MNLTPRYEDEDKSECYELINNMSEKVIPEFREKLEKEFRDLLGVVV